MTPPRKRRPPVRLRAMRRRRLFLATNGHMVIIIRAGGRHSADAYAIENGWTLLTSDEGELAQLVAIGAHTVDAV